MTAISEIVLLMLLLVFAAVTAGSEIAMVAANRFKLKKLAQEGSKAAQMVLRILETPERFFGTILVANNIVDTLIASLLTAVMIALFRDDGRGVVVATMLATFLIIVSEVAAKTLGTRHPEKISIVFSRFINILLVVLSPVVRILTVVTNFIANMIGGKPSGKPSLVSDEEIKALIKIGQEESPVQKEKYRMLSKVFEFSNAVVKNIMTAKAEVLSIDMSDKVNDILDRVVESGYSRIPVCQGDSSKVIGIINMKDLLSLQVSQGLLVLQDIVYPPMAVLGTKKVTDLLKEFQKGHTHIAVVVDPKGFMEGIVTLEDILEEIVGEIEDEFDVRQKRSARRKV